ncbi:hypothetical protein KF728_29150 [Candidatus Obscuribacterales bacterium]|nr:hypothetical protein [Candidatus Obscuribacterales bacterium]
MSYFTEALNGLMLLQACILICTLIAILGVAGSGNPARGSENVQTPQECSRPVGPLIPDSSLVDEVSKISFDILFISPFKRDSKAGNPENNGLLTLSFTNREPETIQIPFSKIACGKGAHLANTPETAPKFAVRKEDSNLGCYAAETALLRYQWFDSAEKCTLIGQAIFTNDKLEITPSESQVVHLPVKVPVEEGRYRLALQFDNTMIPLLHPGTNNRLIEIKTRTGPKPRFIHRDLSAYFIVTQRSTIESERN